MKDMLICPIQWKETGKIPKWLTIKWWKYLFETPRYAGILKTAICRAKGHPAGVWWYDLNDIEPDMHCKNCGDDLG